MRSAATGVTLVALILLSTIVLPVGASPRPVGISPGDVLLYKYFIYKNTPSTSTGNETSTQTFNETITINSINLTTPEGEVGYTLKIDAILNTTHSTTTVLKNNFTTMFDPFNNNTYQGRLGFPAFAYTDLTNGTRSFTFNYIFKGQVPPNQTIPPQNFNVTVARTRQSVHVNFTEIPFQSPVRVIPWNATMNFDPNTGVLRNFLFITYLFGTYTDFSYTLLSYTHNPQFDLSLLWWIAGGAIVVAAAAAVLDRPSRRKRKVDKMKDKFGRP